MNNYVINTKIESVSRYRNTANANPQYLVTTTHGTYRTEPDAQIAYSIESLAGLPVEMRISTDSNRIMEARALYRTGYEYAAHKWDHMSREQRRYYGRMGWDAVGFGEWFAKEAVKRTNEDCLVVLYDLYMLDLIDEDTFGKAGK